MNDYQKKIEELIANESFCEKVRSASGADEIAALFCQEGLQVTAEDITKLMASTSVANDELSEEMLENVSGGRIRGLFYWIGYGLGQIFKSKTGIDCGC